MTASSKRDVFAALYGNRQALGAAHSEVDALQCQGHATRKPDKLLRVEHSSLLRQEAFAQLMQARIYREALLNPPDGMRVAATESDSVVYEALDSSYDAAMTSAPGRRTVNRRALRKRRKANKAAKLSRRRNR